ncbi:Yip1 family protein [Neobacillus sp. LXY-1]|uniref:Yip1 family protein n=1 Tax=Neobacillus sp. LXY-1 TaxID=3379133 RepID=UPI003EDEE296
MELEKEMNVKEESPRLFGMFASPGTQFERIRRKPKFWVPLIVVSVLYAVGMGLMAASMDVSTLIDQGVPKDQAEMVLGITKITMAVTGILTPVFGILISTVIQLIIAKIASSPVTFKQLFSMNAFISIIGAVGLLLNMAIKFGIGGNPQIYITSVAGLLNLDKPGVLGSLEVFGIWSTILTAIGLNRTAEFSKGLAWTIAIVMFLIQIGFALMGTVLQGAPKL